MRFQVEAVAHELRNPGIDPSRYICWPSLLCECCACRGCDEIPSRGGCARAAQPGLVCTVAGEEVRARQRGASLRAREAAHVALDGLRPREHRIPGKPSSRSHSASSTERSCLCLLSHVSQVLNRSSCMNLLSPKGSYGMRED